MIALSIYDYMACFGIVEEILSFQAEIQRFIEYLEFLCKFVTFFGFFLKTLDKLHGVLADSVSLIRFPYIISM